MSTKAYLRISIALNILIILFIGGKRLYYSRFEIAPDTKQKAYADEYNKLYRSVYDMMPIDTTDIVFLGTSITQGFPVYELLGPGFKNRGTGSNTTVHMLGRLDNIKNAEKVFIEAGINDFVVDKRSVTETFGNFKRIIGELNGKCVVQSLLPVSDSKYADSVSRLNQLLNEYCFTNNIGYLDLYTLIGKMDSKNSVDGLHPNARVYKVWAGEIKKYLRAAF